MKCRLNFRRLFQFIPTPRPYYFKTGNEKLAIKKVKKRLSLTKFFTIFEFNHKGGESIEKLKNGKWIQIFPEMKKN